MESNNKQQPRETDIDRGWNSWLRRQTRERGHGIANRTTHNRGRTNEVPDEPSSPNTGGSLKREDSRSPSPAKRSRPRAGTGGVAPDDFDRGLTSGGRLWNPEDNSTTAQPRLFDKANVASNHRLRVSGTQNNRGQRGANPRTAVASQPPPEDDDVTKMISQPVTRPISQEQLVAEVKGIYAGLVMVESKCIEVDNSQNAQNSAPDLSNKLNNEQWQALIALHRTLLHEHHDFFLASQHPSASPALMRLASKYAMPARMWRHGIHSFLELLRHRLPASLEHMLAFIYLAYSMMALLYETVPAFEDTWIECLGDLGRYRMAIEDDDIRDREVWTAVSRGWYSKASAKAPTTGRLYHHLAILARPHALQQLFYYSKALCVELPFASARESIMTLFEPILNETANPQTRLAPAEITFVRCHGIMFSKKMTEKLTPSIDEFLGGLDTLIARSSRRWLESGYYMAIATCCSIFGYGNTENPVFPFVKQSQEDTQSQDQQMEGSEIAESSPPRPTQNAQTTAARQQMLDALTLANGMHSIVLCRLGDPNVLPYIHVVLTFLLHLTLSPEAMSLVEQGFPGKRLSEFLNTLMAEGNKNFSLIEGAAFPEPEKADATRPLPEDYAMRGLPWVADLFPKKWFSNERIDEEEKTFEVPSMCEERKERVLFLACRMATRSHGRWLSYDKENRVFRAGSGFSGSADVEAERTSDLGVLPDAAHVGIVAH